MNTISAPRIETVDELGIGRLELFPIAPDEETLLSICRELFENHWQSIVFGTLILGAVFECKATAAPKKISLFDGYLTVDFGAWHFHVCIGAHKGSANNPVDPELARIRRTGRAELYRQLGPEGAPQSWGLRLFNGRGEQQMTVFLPNPFIGDDGNLTRNPDWSRLVLWDALRARYLGLPPDPRDRAATAFFHG
ncbi:MAG: hypothetical protein FJX67_14310 [Alphaproteobacteria bacterium]|nr:hypothetical protein [Alphaproteobacteria bacterium]